MGVTHVLYSSRGKGFGQYLSSTNHSFDRGMHMLKIGGEGGGVDNVSLENMVQ